MPPKRSAEEASLIVDGATPEPEVEASATTTVSPPAGDGPFTYTQIVQLAQTSAADMVGHELAHLIVFFNFLLAAKAAGANLFEARVRCPETVATISRVVRPDHSVCSPNCRWPLLTGRITQLLGPRPSGVPVRLYRPPRPSQHRPR